MKDSFYHHGDIAILENYKTAFLCSQKVSSATVLKSYDWAVKQKNNGNCIVSGFHSKIEKDVFDFLLQGAQPVIMVLARGLQKKYSPEVVKALDAQRLLIITPFEESVDRITRDTAAKRNVFMTDIADEICFGYVRENGNLEKLMHQLAAQGKKMSFLDESVKEKLLFK